MKTIPRENNYFIILIRAGFSYFYSSICRRSPSVGPSFVVVGRADVELESRHERARSDLAQNERSRVCALPAGSRFACIATCVRVFVFSLR